MKLVRFEAADSDRRTRFLLAAMKGTDWPGQVARLQESLDRTRAVPEIQDLFEQGGVDLLASLKGIAVRDGSLWCEFAAALRARNRSERPSLAEFSKLDEVYGELLGSGSYVWPLLRCLQSMSAQIEGDLTAAEFHLREARRSLD
jgi:hypothetical protein